MRQARPGHRAALETLTALLAEREDLDLVGAWRAGTGLDAIVRADRAAADRSTTAHSAPTHSAPTEGHHR